ncbi:MAG TPA: T9SS type A sorting domain-containing protein [Bacteroidia bacterium]
MKKIILVLLSTIFALQGKAQLGKEAWHWNFGQNCSLDFSSGTPNAGTSKINVHEGCASISDPNTGQLLFYTDGDTVWDKNNNIMPNGFDLINGGEDGGFDGTTTQAATVIPKPGSNNLYYLITADYIYQPNKGVFYSVVDMNFNGGLGDITIKNRLLTPPPTTEKVVATRHCNGVDYWVLTHTYYSNNFNAYLISSVGIDTIPVISSIGTVEQSGGSADDGGIGYLKASPNGRKLAACIFYYSPNPIVEVYDFDNATGQVSNSITIPMNLSVDSGSYYYAYGCSFSPDNTKLYVTTTGEFLNTNNILQYDLSSSVPSTIISSCTTMTASTTSLCALQIAPNGKIYIAYQGINEMGVINSPNSLGLACNYLPNAVSLLGTCWMGLPNFIDAGISTTYTCGTSSIIQFANSNEQINIYPNPNNGSFVIEPNINTKQTMHVYDVNGKMVLSQIINGKTTIDASSLNEGVYNISLQSNEGIINKRLVIVR